MYFRLGQCLRCAAKLILHSAVSAFGDLDVPVCEPHGSYSATSILSIWKGVNWSQTVCQQCPCSNGSGGDFQTFCHYVLFVDKKFPLGRPVYALVIDACLYRGKLKWNGAYSHNCSLDWGYYLTWVLANIMNESSLWMWMFVYGLPQKPFEGLSDLDSILCLLAGWSCFWTG